MRIALLTWAYPPEKSGLTRAAREIAQSLADAGNDVTVFAMDRREDSRDGRVSVVGCGLREGSIAARLRKVVAIGHLVAPIAFRRAVAREHRRAPFDVVEATNWYAPGLAIALARPAPLVTRNSTPAATSAATATSLRDRIDRRAAMLVERIAARRSKALISNTQLHGEKVAALYGVAAPGEDGRHAVIGLSLPPEIVARGAAAPYPTGEPIQLLFVGRDEHRKGFDALIMAHRILSRRADAGMRDFRLTIVGVHADDVGAIPGSARARLTCHHRVEEAKLHDLMEAAHVIVAPSRYESFGLVYQEAMMFGRPVVACAEDPSARLFIGASGAGLLARRCTGDDLATQVQRLIEDTGLRTHHAEASRRASGMFTRDTLAAETIAVYRTAAESNGASSSASSSGRPAPVDIAS
ncbi:Glycosyl transferase family 1 [Sphingomonas aurantiaca]|uniref:Glycosyl transferase family 1 n=1 Tax=Sphingomonas aurantiaca TaxID=185949 RepID=A0A5E7ZIS6_9SPHN|nr:glycosyltransferase family 4 protein [Sphingomonas aurantiaca]VVT19030.1 Glycosyl transferase family 1 [Sphingomonas aurantiaca]